MTTFRFSLLAAFLLVLAAPAARADSIGEMQRLIEQQPKIASEATSQTMAAAPLVTETTAPAAIKSAEIETIRPTPDSTKVIHLDQDAASVLVANPQHAGVLLDNPRLLVIMPKQPGSTSLTVLDANGATIMEKRILITGTQAKYVRVRRMCGSDSSCVPSSYFYCPDGCYEVAPVPAGDALADIPEVQGAPASSVTAPSAAASGNAAQDDSGAVNTGGPTAEPPPGVGPQ